MGDLPTTRAISILRYGDSGPPDMIGENMYLYHYPLDLLRDLHIVDTRAPIRSADEEALTRNSCLVRIWCCSSPVSSTAHSERARFSFTLRSGERRSCSSSTASIDETRRAVDHVREYLTREIQAVWCYAPRCLISALRALRGKVGRRPRSIRATSIPLERYAYWTLRERASDSSCSRHSVSPPLEAEHYHTRWTAAGSCMRMRVSASIRDQLEWRTRKRCGRIPTIPPRVRNALYEWSAAAGRVRADHSHGMPLPSQPGCGGEPVSIRGRPGYAQAIAHWCTDGRLYRATQFEARGASLPNWMRTRRAA